MRPDTMVLTSFAVLVACEGGLPTRPDDDGGPRPSPDAACCDDARALPPDGAAPLDDGCPSIFDAAIVPDYHLTISDTEWAALVDEFLNRATRIEAGLPEHPYHPVELEYEGASGRERPAAPVLIRLKGQSSWQQTIDLDENPKMQFVISFNGVDPDARFHGLRKVELDMPRSDRTFLKQRVALSFMREAGVTAQCANSARVHINGVYYGLYAHLERLDKEFLQRHFDDDDEGDLWKAGRVITTNEESYDQERIDAFWAVSSADELEAIADLDASLRAWAAEAMIGDADGYHVGTANFFVYDHPDRGFLWLPHDIDAALDGKLDADESPVLPEQRYFDERYRKHYLLAMLDPARVARYAAALRVARSHYDVAALQGRLDAWAAQIAEAVAADPHRSYPLEEHEEALARVRAYIPARAAHIDAWLACWFENSAIDGDGDGVDLCHDCDDGNASVHPGAPDHCDAIDNNCDGRPDSVGGVATCP